MTKVFFNESLPQNWSNDRLSLYWAYLMFQQTNIGIQYSQTTAREKNVPSRMIPTWKMNNYERPGTARAAVWRINGCWVFTIIKCSLQLQLCWPSLLWPARVRLMSWHPASSTPEQSQANVSFKWWHLAALGCDTCQLASQPVSGTESLQSDCPQQGLWWCPESNYAGSLQGSL